VSDRRDAEDLAGEVFVRMLGAARRPRWNGMSTDGISIWLR